MPGPGVSTYAGTKPLMRQRRCNVFDPDATLAMGEAYDKAIATIHTDAQSQFVVRELSAKRIIRMAQKRAVTNSALPRA